MEASFDHSYIVLWENAGNYKKINIVYFSLKLCPKLRN